MAMLQMRSTSPLHDAPRTAGAIAWFAGVRLVVAALCVVFLLTFAQLALRGLLAYYTNIAPYAGAG